MYYWFEGEKEAILSQRRAQENVFSFGIISANFEFRDEENEVVESEWSEGLIYMWYNYREPSG